jgi:hypothetical protein
MIQADRSKFHYAFRLSLLDHEEAAPVRGNVVHTGRCQPGSGEVTPLKRLPRQGKWHGDVPGNGDAHKLAIQRQVKLLATVSGPDGLGTSRGRDLEFRRVHVWKRPYEYLRRARITLHIRQPPSAWRHDAGSLNQRCANQRPWPAIGEPQ